MYKFLWKLFSICLEKNNRQSSYKSKHFAMASIMMYLEVNLNKHLKLDGLGILFIGLGS